MSGISVFLGSGAPASSIRQSLWYVWVYSSCWCLGCVPSVVPLAHSGLGYVSIRRFNIACFIYEKSGVVRLMELLLIVSGGA